MVLHLFGASLKLQRRIDGSAVSIAGIRVINMQVRSGCGLLLCGWKYGGIFIVVQIWLVGTLEKLSSNHNPETAGKTGTNSTGNLEGVR